MALMLCGLFQSARRSPSHLCLCPFDHYLVWRFSVGPALDLVLFQLSTLPQCSTRVPAILPTLSTNPQSPSVILAQITQHYCDGMNAYMAYKVFTQTTLAMFRSPTFSVRRRYSDFLGLYEKLSEKHGPNGYIVPPPPEKTCWVSSSSQNDQNEGGERRLIVCGLFERRRGALERYLQRVVSHPTLLQDPDVREFLEREELPRAVNTQALSGAGFLKMINRATDAVSKMTIKMNESDVWFEDKLQEVESADQQFRSFTLWSSLWFSTEKSRAEDWLQIVLEEEEKVVFGELRNKTKKQLELQLDKCLQDKKWGECYTIGNVVLKNPPNPKDQPGTDSQAKNERDHQPKNKETTSLKIKETTSPNLEQTTSPKMKESTSPNLEHTHVLKLKSTDSPNLEQTHRSNLEQTHCPNLEQTHSSYLESTHGTNLEQTHPSLEQKMTTNMKPLHMVHPQKIHQLKPLRISLTLAMSQTRSQICKVSPL
ncbi:hypothetical protein WMY93_023743 [Mugilogobius chulae]|uniref:PX domain-containing protein n=1 Tax=Mugilogobius chulae TaxID=88201 RepID=A0AAW0NG85_9GOBI